MEPTEHFEHDPDDPPVQENIHWHWWNRWAEELMRVMRLLGILK